MNRHGLSPRVVVLLIALVVVLFSLSVLLSAYDDPESASQGKAGPGAYSISALGYAGLYDLLQRLGWRVSRGVPPDDLAARTLLVAAEPMGDHGDRLRQALSSRARKLLVVLPKWKGTSADNRSKWVGEIKTLPAVTVENIFSQTNIAGSVARSGWSAGWTTNEIGIAPTGSHFVQLIRSDELIPLVEGEDGILLGEFRAHNRTIWVLSDPDVMSNHGIVNGDNAAFMLAVFKRMAGDEGVPVFFDEALHGYRQRQASPLRLLVEFPFVVVTALAALFAVLVLWSGASRFGQPDRASPPVGFGKKGLIDNSARLMEYSGHQEYVLRRYVLMNMRAAAAALHAPKLGDADLASWLDRVGRARGVGVSCADILKRMQAQRSDETGVPGLLACAREIHRWREDLLRLSPRVEKE